MADSPMFVYPNLQNTLGGPNDKEKERCKTCSTGWISLLNCIYQLATVEKLYVNMTYLAPKGFLRKECSIRLNYETLLTELAEIDRKQVPRLSSCNTNLTKITQIVTQYGRLDQLTTQLILFIQARLLMLTFYEQLANLPANKSLCYEYLINHITEIIQKNSTSFQLHAVEPIKTLFGFECDLVNSLLKSQKSMQEWQFLEALIHLQDVHVKLQQWQSIIHSKEAKKHRSGSSFVKSTTLPLLYQWFWMAKYSFTAKFSLYFYETLLEQSHPGEMKSLLSRQSSDYVSKIQNFCRKTDVHSFNIVLDTNDLKNYKGKGYIHPIRETLPLEGIDTFPSIFSYPQFPEPYWPSIIMRVSDKALEYTDRVLYFFDAKDGVTYFVCRVECRMTIAVLYESQKSEKDVFIRDFIMDISSLLRCSKVFIALKPK